ncbi:MAG: hypothetical protein PVH68_05955 [Armatimonadota bacterium]|jgi:hypothetical protein
MRLLFIIIDQSIEPDVLEVFEEHGVQLWTSWTDVHGAGRTGRKEGNPVWPGLNTIFLVALPEENVEPIVQGLHAARDSFPLTPGMRIFSVPAEQM